MSEEQNTQNKIQAPQDLPVTILAQYIRDISFENPNTPESLRAHPDAPEIDVNIGMDARKIEDEKEDRLYEVVLSVRAEAKRDGSALFIMELQYGATILVASSVPEDNVHPLLLIEIPHMLFPYVRMLVSEVTSNGGFPPLFLTPVNFQSLYLQRFSDEIKAAQATSSQADGESIN